MLSVYVVYSSIYYLLLDVGFVTQMYPSTSVMSHNEKIYIHKSIHNIIIYRIPTIRILSTMYNYRFGFYYNIIYILRTIILTIRLMIMSLQVL